MQEVVQKKLGERIRALRKGKGWSQEEFADYCELDRTYVGAIERGERNLTLRSLVIISKTLTLRLSELVEGVDP